MVDMGFRRIPYRVEVTSVGLAHARPIIYTNLAEMAVYAARLHALR